MRRSCLVVAVFALLAGCAAAPEPRPLTVTEAERLAMVRFVNFTEQTSDFTAVVPTAGGRLHLTGRVDFVRHLGYAVQHTEGRDDPDSQGLVLWSPTLVALRPGVGAELSAPPPQEGWQVRQLRTSGSELDGALRLVVSLGADRPDNAQLLAQSSARWLRADTVGTSTVDVLEGPQPAGQAETGQPVAARLRYWVGTDGRLRRVEARLGDQQEFAVIDLTSPGGPIPTVPGVSGN